MAVFPLEESVWKNLQFWMKVIQNWKKGTRNVRLPASNSGIYLTFFELALWLMFPSTSPMTSRISLNYKYVIVVQFSSHPTSLFHGNNIAAAVFKQLRLFRKHYVVVMASRVWQALKT